MTKVHTLHMASRLGNCPMNFGGAKRDVSQRLKNLFPCQGFVMQSLYPKSVYILTRREVWSLEDLVKIPVKEKQLRAGSWWTNLWLALKWDNS